MIKKTLILLLLCISYYNKSQESQKEIKLARHSKEATVSHSWVEISSSNFIENIKKMKEILSQGTDICVVMKADAYGHGIQNMLPYVLKQNIKCIAIASNEEAKEVRLGGYTGQLIRIRAAIHEEIKQGVKYQIQEILGNLETAKYIDQLATDKNINIPVHLFLNSSGMSRNGIDISTEKSKQQLKYISKLKSINIVGIMTHFPVEEEEDIKKVFSTFKKEIDWVFSNTSIKRENIKLHVANSFAAIKVPQTHLDIVRVGGALYGDMSPPIQGFERLMSFKSKVAQINEYPQGNSVGYDRTFILNRNSKLANIPVGYSDGYRRVFSNKAHVLIRGHRVPVLGKISMNIILVDVTDFPDIKESDEVVLFGKQENEEITQEELEEINGAIIGDLYTIWGKINPRIVY